jgi:hypothetical protein
MNVALVGARRRHGGALAVGWPQVDRNGGRRRVVAPYAVTAAINSPIRGAASPDRGRRQAVVFQPDFIILGLESPTPSTN